MYLYFFTKNKNCFKQKKKKKNVKNCLFTSCIINFKQYVLKLQQYNTGIIKPLATNMSTSLII